MTTHPNHTNISPAELYIARHATPASQATAKSTLNTAARFLGGDDHSLIDWALSYADAARIRADVNALEPAWARVVWSSVRQVAAEARRLGRIDADTAAAIFELPAPRESGGHRGTTPTRDEVADLLAVAAGHTTLRGRRDAAVVAILAGCGLRRAEAAALCVRDVDLTQSTLLVRSGRGRRQRPLPLPSWTADLVESWIITSDVACWPRPPM